MANLIIFYRMTLSVSISHPCIPRRKSKSFGYSYMHGCYRMVHHHISSLLFSNNYLALLVSHATFSPKWFQMRSSFRSNQPIWCTPCWYIIDGEFGAPYVLTHMDCIFGLCNAECLTEDTQADVCWVCIKTKGDKNNRFSFHMVRNSNRVWLKGGMIKISQNDDNKTLFIAVASREYAAIILAGISSQNEIQSKLKCNIRPRECEKKSSKKTGLMWYGLATAHSSYFITVQGSVTKVTILNIGHFISQTVSFSSMIWVRDESRERERIGEMTMSTEKKR